MAYSEEDWQMEQARKELYNLFHNDAGKYLPPDKKNIQRIVDFSRNYKEKYPAISKAVENAFAQACREYVTYFTKDENRPETLNGNAQTLLEQAIARVSGGVFEDYELESLEIDKEDKDGAQKKARMTGVYKQNEKQFYIKKSEKFTADNIAEVLTSRILKELITTQAIEYTFIVDPTDNSVYVASEILSGSKTLKKLNPDVLKIIGIGTGANPLLDSHKDKIYESLSAEQRQDMGQILAACALVNEGDCQVGNILCYEDNGIQRAAKFDDGWGLADLCRPGFQRISLFDSIGLIGKSGSHRSRIGGKPTNHYNDYPKIIKSQDFVDGIQTVLNNFDRDSILKLVNNTLAEIREKYGDQNKEALSAFAKHIGIKKANWDNLDIDAMHREILRELTESLCKRRDSLMLVKCFVEMDLAINNNKLTKEELETILNRIIETIANHFTSEEGYHSDEDLMAIMPDYKPSRTTLIANLKQIASELKIHSNLMECLDVMGEKQVSLSSLQSLKVVPSQNAQQNQVDDTPPEVQGLINGLENNEVIVPNKQPQVLESNHPDESGIFFLPHEKLDKEQALKEDISKEDQKHLLLKHKGSSSSSNE